VSLAETAGSRPGRRATDPAQRRPKYGGWRCAGEPGRPVPAPERHLLADRV